LGEQFEAREFEVAAHRAFDVREAAADQRAHVLFAIALRNYIDIDDPARKSQADLPPVMGLLGTHHACVTFLQDVVAKPQFIRNFVADRERALAEGLFDGRKPAHAQIRQQVGCAVQQGNGKRAAKQFARLIPGRAVADPHTGLATEMLISLDLCRHVHEFAAHPSSTGTCPGTARLT